MAGFAKLFSSIITSSIWVEDHETLRCWVALLALADSNGDVEGAVPGLASLCRLSLPKTEAVLLRLASPDPYSRSPEHDGRRIEVIPGGWRVLNYAAYRDRGQGKEGSRAPYMREYRRRLKGENPEPQQGGQQQGERNSTDVTRNVCLLLPSASVTDNEPTDNNGSPLPPERPAARASATERERLKLEADADVVALADAWARHRGKDGKRELGVLRAAKAALLAGYERPALEMVSRLVALAGREPERFRERCSIRWTAEHKPAASYVWRTDALDRLIPEAEAWARD